MVGTSSDMSESSTSSPTVDVGPFDASADAVSYSPVISLSDSLTMLTCSFVSTILSAAMLLTRAVIPLVAIASAIAITSIT